MPLIKLIVSLRQLLKSKLQIRSTSKTRLQLIYLWPEESSNIDTIQC